MECGRVSGRGRRCSRVASVSLAPDCSRVFTAESICVLMITEVLRLRIFEVAGMMGDYGF
jgi:hypothetical protein